MQRIQELQEENNYLRQNAGQKTSAAAFGGISSPTSKQQIPNSILRQLEALKQEN